MHMCGLQYNPTDVHPLHTVHYTPCREKMAVQRVGASYEPAARLLEPRVSAEPIAVARVDIKAHVGLSSPTI